MRIQSGPLIRLRSPSPGGAPSDRFVSWIQTKFPPQRYGMAELICHPSSTAEFKMIARTIGEVPRMGMGVRYPENNNRLTFDFYECNSAAMSVAREIRDKFGIAAGIAHLQIQSPPSRITRASQISQPYNHYVVDVDALLRQSGMEENLEGRNLLLRHQGKCYLDPTPLAIREEDILSAEPYDADGESLAHLQHYPVEFGGRSPMTWPRDGRGFALAVGIMPPEPNLPVSFVLSGEWLDEGAYTGEGFYFTLPVYADQWADIRRALKEPRYTAQLRSQIIGSEQHLAGHTALSPRVTIADVKQQLEQRGLAVLFGCVRLVGTALKALPANREYINWVDYKVNDPDAFMGIPGGGYPKAGRNDPCPCGSGSKYKKCHGS